MCVSVGLLVTLKCGSGSNIVDGNPQDLAQLSGIYCDNLRLQWLWGLGSLAD